MSGDNITSLSLYLINILVPLLELTIKLNLEDYLQRCSLGKDYTQDAIIANSNEEYIILYHLDYTVMRVVCKR
jgi:hypothetical protein